MLSVRLFLLVTTLFTFSKTHAQQGRIRGHIAGPDGQPVAGITIRLEPGIISTQTDDNGNFEFRRLSAAAWALMCPACPGNS